MSKYLKVHPTLKQAFRLLKYIIKGNYFKISEVSGRRISMITKIQNRISDLGEEIQLTLDLGLVPEIIHRGHWQPELCDFIVEGVKICRRVLVLDLGAHAGLVSRQVAISCQRNAESTLDPFFVCVEPNSDEFRNLIFNLQRFDHKECLNVGIHEKLSKITLTSDWVNSGNSTTISNLIPWYRKGKKFQVETLTLKDIIGKYDKILPIIIKSDVEGQDLSLLLSLDEIAWNRIERFVVELYGDFHHELSLLLNKLEAFDLYWPSVRQPISAESLLEMSRKTFVYSSDLFGVRKISEAHRDRSFI